MWISVYPHMDDKTFISFLDFKEKLTGRSKKHDQTVDEQISMCKMLNAAYGGE
jgi:hypothetical protein